MRPLRILLVLLEPPLPFGNAAARWFYVLLKGLVEHGHRVTAFAACSKPEEIPRAQALFPAPAYDLRCYPFPVRSGMWAKLETLRRPYSYMFSADLRRDLQTELARGFDILHLEQLWSGWLGLRHADRALVSVHYLNRIDQEEVRPAGWRQRLLRRLTFAAERRLVRHYPHLRACSPRLAEALRQLSPGADISSGAFGIDLGQYSYVPDERRSPKPVISVIGSMGWYPSHSAAVRLLTRLWPEIHRQVPEASVQVVGWNARTALADFLGMPGVTVEENVPEIRPAFERTTVHLYAPARGSGMKIKVLESLGFGVPVVTTSEGVEGLPAEDGVHAGVCDDDAGLVERTVRLLRDPEAQNRQRRAGRALLEQVCAPAATLDALELAYGRIVSGGAAGR
jgi:glycosyltransferase involved in cell wall biosynthesis